MDGQEYVTMREDDIIGVVERNYDKLGEHNMAAKDRKIPRRRTPQDGHRLNILAEQLK